jgi:hypothetical protein
MGLKHTDLDNILQHALKQGRTVELALADEHGYTILVDGEPLTETTSGHGLPHETFGTELDCISGLTDTSQALLDELEQGYRAAVRARRTDRLETDQQATTHGVDR